jgi:hypothetical protein
MYPFMGAGTFGKAALKLWQVRRDRNGPAEV